MRSDESQRAEWRRFPDGENEGGDKRGGSPTGFPERASGYGGQVGQEQGAHVGGVEGLGSLHTQRPGEKWDLPMGPCGQNVRWLEKAALGQRLAEELEVLLSDCPI